MAGLRPHNNTHVCVCAFTEAALHSRTLQSTRRGFPFNDRDEYPAAQVLSRRAAAGAVDSAQYLSFLAALLLGRMTGIAAYGDPQRRAAVVGAAARAAADAGSPGEVAWSQLPDLRL